MDLVQELLDLIGQVVWAVVDGLASFLQTLSGSMSQMSDSQAQVCAGSLLFLVFGAFVVRRVNWFKLKLFEPQTVTLRTEKTPWQVLADDTKGCFLSMILVVVLAIIAYSLITGL
jgi:hypothetical protein